MAIDKLNKTFVPEQVLEAEELNLITDKVDEIIDNIPDVSNYITTTTADSKYQPKGNYLTSIPSEYVTETELDGKDYATTTDLDNYVTISTANSTFATKEELGNIDSILDNINGEVIS